MNPCESFTVYACEPEGRRHLLARFHGPGAVLPKTEPRRPSAAATSVQADPALISELRQTCVHCGRGIGKNSKRCIHCGNFVKQG